MSELATIFADGVYVGGGFIFLILIILLIIYVARRT